MSWPHVLMALAWLTGWVLLWRVPHLGGRPAAREPDEGEGADAGPTAIVIPARDEQASLPLLLEDLRTRRPSGSRVIVVDDQSTDDTASVARAFDFVEVVEAPPLEEGWIGKTWACHQGAERAGEGFLVFLDADVRIHDDALERAVEICRRSGGLVTVWPYHAVRRPYEHLSALFNVVTMMAVGAGSLVPPRRPRGGFGGLMATSVADYRTVGGHAAVRDRVIDDFALARRYSDAGLSVANHGGGRSVSIRMYPAGILSLLGGWTKNYAAGAGSMPIGRIFAVMCWLTFSLGVFKWGGGVPRPIPTIFLGLYAVQMYVFFRQVGRFGVVDALLYPLYVCILALVFARSLWRTYVVRSVVWRGRRVSTRGGG